MTDKRTSETMEMLLDPNRKIAGQPQQFKYGYEVPKKIFEEYDWLDEADKADNWLNHHDRWYHLSDFMRIDHSSKMYPKWDGYHNDSAFSGVVIKILDTGEGAFLRTFIN